MTFINLLTHELKVSHIADSKIKKNRHYLQYFKPIKIRIICKIYTYTLNHTSLYSLQRALQFLLCRIQYCYKKIMHTSPFVNTDSTTMLTVQFELFNLLYI